VFDLAQRREKGVSLVELRVPLGELLGEAEWLETSRSDWSRGVCTVSSLSADVCFHLRQPNGWLGCGQWAMRTLTLALIVR